MSLISKALALNANKKWLCYTKLTYGRQGIFFGAKFMNTDAKPKDAGKYTPVYKFPYVKAMSIVNRLKLYHTILIGVAAPGTFALNQLNIIDVEIVIATCISGFAGALILYNFGFLCNKFIGIIYINEGENEVKLSYVDFWGARKDTIVSLEDIVPLSDMPTKITDGLYRTFTRFSKKETLKLNLSRGIVLDPSKFNKIFGAP